MPSERHDCPDCGASHRIKGLVCRCDCDRPVFSEGMCRAHYHRWERGHFDLSPINPRSRRGATDQERFWDKVFIGDKNGCDVWQADLNRGYGKFQVGGKHIQAHRYAWELVNGPIPAGLELDHLCRNRACVKVAHLEVVTHAENCRRAALARRGEWDFSTTTNQ